MVFTDTYMHTYLLHSVRTQYTYAKFLNKQVNKPHDLQTKNAHIYTHTHHQTYTCVQLCECPIYFHQSSSSYSSSTTTTAFFFFV